MKHFAVKDLCATRNRTRILIVAAIIALLLFNIGLLAERRQLNQEVEPIPKYHFYAVFQNSVDPFWEEVKRGVTDAAKEFDVAVEFNAPRFNDSKEEGQFIDIATLSKVDGIITHAANEPSFINLIDKADDQGIPVVTIENDAKDSQRKAFVGSDSYLLGQQAGKLVKEATQGNAQIAIILSSDSQKDTVTQNVMIDGFLSAIKDEPGMAVKKVYTSKMGILSAEEITRSIINSKDINAIFSVDTIDTIGVAQTVVDFNKVGDISIVGYGVSSEVLRYIDKGIVYGSVVGDPYKIGYESVRALVSAKEEKAVPAFIDTGVDFISKSNLNTKDAATLYAKYSGRAGD